MLSQLFRIFLLSQLVMVLGVGASTTSAAAEETLAARISNIRLNLTSEFGSRVPPHARLGLILAAGEKQIMIGDLVGDFQNQHASLRSELYPAISAELEHNQKGSDFFLTISLQGENGEPQSLQTTTATIDSWDSSDSGFLSVIADTKKLNKPFPFMGYLKRKAETAETQAEILHAEPQFVLRVYSFAGGKKFYSLEIPYTDPLIIAPMVISGPMTKQESEQALSGADFYDLNEDDYKYISLLTGAGWKNSSIAADPRISFVIEGKGKDAGFTFLVDFPTGMDF